VLTVATAYSMAVMKLKNRLLKELGEHIESIILYGSVAKKKAHEDSDIDILIVTRNYNKEFFDKISRIRTEIDLDNNTFTSLFYVSREELERYAKLGSLFIKSVAKEGVILHDRGIFKKTCESLLIKS
jgi:predicted nucleotidyltransferase